MQARAIDQKGKYKILAIALHIAQKGKTTYRVPLAATRSLFGSVKVPFWAASEAQLRHSSRFFGALDGQDQSIRWQRHARPAVNKLHRACLASLSACGRHLQLA
ncbi:uncharacterized protein Triagg1_427 [Trichoderma aggressivum f. europaeum]|uniref:Uncharacterized protein n=1 Tax=Trichoderma aggressivum f. europaeum TaxID=173218 RepID=A0AAE1IKB2_9HYPO|nr:hypothetical protein Triagg1_427 [Trichoderma aggressivum f. europaeum]